MLRAIQEIKPAFVIAENVFGITNIDDGLVFEQVCLDLEAEGYEVQPFIIPAASKNAPHRRDRVWFIATNTDGSTERSSKKSGGVKIKRSHYNDEPSQWEKPTQFDIRRYEFLRNATNTDGNRLQRGVSSDFNKQQRSQKINVKKCVSTHRNGIPFEEFPTQSPICGGDDGLPTELDGITFSKWRSESIKGYGNAIVPQVAYEIFKQL